MMKMLIDADTGIDDSLAILFALKQKNVQVVGITTGFGNTDADQAAENSIRLIALAKTPYEVPVVVGAKGPLVGEWDGPVPHIHGNNGIGDADIPASKQKPLEEDASDFIIRMAKEHGRDLTIVTLGRMTNLAQALEKEPNLPNMVKNVVAMGGTFKMQGNVGPYSEANVWGDPEAADQVFLAGFDLTMVGLDVTKRTHLTPAHLDVLEKYCDPDCEPILAYLRKALTLYFNFYRVCENSLDYCPVHDPLAVLVAINPSVVTMKKMPARVECGGTYSRGMVVVDQRSIPMEDAPFVTFCIDVDGDRAVDQILNAFTREN